MWDIIWRRHDLRRAIPACCMLAALGTTLTGCLGQWAHRAADREAYRIIEEKERRALGQSTGLSIDHTTSPLTVRVIGAGQPDPATTATLKLSLATALQLALENNREYQTRKENVYLAALDLTEARNEFNPIFSGNIERTWERAPGPNLEPGETERFGATTTNLGVTQLLATGARITVGFTNELLRTYAGPAGSPLNPIRYPIDQERNQLSASIVQPLLQGFGPTVTLENLRQSERDVIYEIRDFARYRQDFIIDRLAQFLRVLQARDQIENELNALRRLTFRRERAEAMESAERMERFQVDQARQDEFRARNRYVSAQTDYKLLLDEFKLDLGLPLELNIAPDPAELRELRERGLVAVPYDQPGAEALAIGRRRDLLNARNIAEDAERGIAIARNSLLPALDARADWSIRDDGENRRRYDLDARTRRYGFGLNLELPLERKRQRNDFRAAEIERDRARRQVEQLRNQILTEVREALFTLEEARESYEIQLAAEALALRRVENVRMLFDIGREGISIRDQLEAESALRDTQNNITRALVDYTIARLRLFDTIENLEIDERGMPDAPQQTANR